MFGKIITKEWKKGTNRIIFRCIINTKNHESRQIQYLKALGQNSLEFGQSRVHFRHVRFTLSDDRWQFKANRRISAHTTLKTSEISKNSPSKVPSRFKWPAFRGIVFYDDRSDSTTRTKAVKERKKKKTLLWNKHARNPDIEKHGTRQTELLAHHKGDVSLGDDAPGKRR